MAKVLVPLAAGCEELEAVTIIDLLRRANIDVTTAGLDDKPVIASRGTVLVPDTTLDEALRESYDMVVLPGGLPGADNLANDARIMQCVQQMATDGKLIGAICAAPRVLAKSGLLDGKHATAYPGILDGGDFPNITYTGTAFEKAGKIITGRGPGVALDFALEIIELLTDADNRRNVEQALVRS